MREIKLTQGQVALVDDEDYEWLNQFNWCVHRGYSTFYAIRRIVVNDKITVQSMHILIMGHNPEKPMIDHRDGNGCNNQRYNLRPCTHQENMMNRSSQKNSSSIYKGVSRFERDGRWRACIQINGKLKHLGLFNVEIDAAMAYDAAAVIHHGDFKRLNFPETNEKHY